RRDQGIRHRSRQPPQRQTRGDRLRPCTSGHHRGPFGADRSCDDEAASGSARLSQRRSARNADDDGGRFMTATQKTSVTINDRLSELLPVIYRQRDLGVGTPLRQLLGVIAEQVDLVENDIAQLYENWFIETCEDWVVPYIGDLIGYIPAGPSDPAVSP